MSYKVPKETTIFTTVTMEFSKLSNVANKFDKTVFDHENLTKTTWQVKLTIQNMAIEIDNKKYGQ